MFTLDRVSLTTIGLGIGLVLSGCMSPTGETTEAADDEAAVNKTTAAIHEDVNERAMEGNPGLPDQLQPNQLPPQEEGVAPEGAAPEEGEENVDSAKSAIFIGRGFGWGGGLGRFGGFGWGGGLGRFGWGGLGGFGWGGRGLGLGWGGGWGVPVGGFYGGLGGWGLGGVPIGYGYNTGFVGGCGLYGCF